MKTTSYRNYLLSIPDACYGYKSYKIARTTLSVTARNERDARAKAAMQLGMGRCPRGTTILRK